MTNLFQLRYIAISSAYANHINSGFTVTKELTMLDTLIERKENGSFKKVTVYHKPVYTIMEEFLSFDSPNPLQICRPKLRAILILIHRAEILAYEPQQI